MVKAIVLFLIVVIVILYLGIQKSTKMERLSPPSPVEPTVERYTPSQHKREVQQPLKMQTANRKVLRESSVPKESNIKHNASTDERGEEKDESPTVERNRLIGGANVEWIEPQPKKPGDKFGKPPM